MKTILNATALILLGISAFAQSSEENLNKPFCGETQCSQAHKLKMAISLEQGIVVNGPRGVDRSMGSRTGLSLTARACKRATYGTGLYINQNIYTATQADGAIQNIKYTTLEIPFYVSYSLTSCNHGSFNLLAGRSLNTVLSNESTITRNLPEQKNTSQSLEAHGGSYGAWIGGFNYTQNLCCNFQLSATVMGRLGGYDPLKSMPSSTNGISATVGLGYRFKVPTCYTNSCGPNHD